MRTIQLSTKFGIAYYLTSIQDSQATTLFTIKTIKDEDEQNKQLKELGIKWGINLVGILSIGETAKIKGADLSDYIEKFAGKDTHETGMVGHNREVHYRNYRTSAKKQKDIAWLVNTCPDNGMSVRSAVAMMNQEWSIVWRATINSDIKAKMDELLKDRNSCMVQI